MVNMQRHIDVNPGLYYYYCNVITSISTRNVALHFLKERQDCKKSLEHKHKCHKELVKANYLFFGSSNKLALHR